MPMTIILLVLTILHEEYIYNAHEVERLNITVVQLFKYGRV